MVRWSSSDAGTYGSVGVWALFRSVGMLMTSWSDAVLGFRIAGIFECLVSSAVVWPVAGLRWGGWLMDRVRAGVLADLTARLTADPMAVALRERIEGAGVRFRLRSCVISTQCFGVWGPDQTCHDRGWTWLRRWFCKAWWQRRPGLPRCGLPPWNCQLRPLCLLLLSGHQWIGRRQLFSAVNL